MRKMLSLTALIGGLVAASTAQADITIGFVTSLSGPGSSIGIPYGRGIQAAMEYKNEVNGEKIKLIQLDDGSDPSAATRNARKLIEEEKVDLLIGTATAPSTIAMMAVATELKVPMIAVSPVIGQPNPADQWGISVPQPASLLVKVVADRMKRDAMKNIGYIGFSDAWGDLVYNGAKAVEAEDGIKVLTNERYARVDTSVTGQILKVLAVRPDAVLIGGSGTQGALPLLALGERGFKGKTYGTVALVNPDFVRVGGKAAEGIQVSAGPVIVAEQLPDNHFAKKLALEFPRRLPEGQQCPDHGRLLGLLLRRLEDLHLCRRARAEDRETRHRRIPQGHARRDPQHQGALGRARGLQLQARRLPRRGRARAGDRPPEQRRLDLRALSDTD